MRGLIEIEKGSKGGPIIKGSSPNQAMESLAFLIRSQNVSVDHLIEFRQKIKRDVAELAA